MEKQEIWEWAGSQGQGVRIALLDTGIERAHGIFFQREIIVRDICDPRGNGKDIDGHGTLCAAIISDVAPRSTLLVGRILDRHGNFTYDTLLGGLHWALNERANLICVCGGEPFEDTDVSAEISSLAAQNVCVLSAIGNHGKTGRNAGVFPARCAEAIAIGSANEKGEISTFTDLPSGKEIFCPPLEEYTVPDHTGLMCSIMGTSVSASWMTGILALLMSTRQGRLPFPVLQLRLREASSLQESNRGPYRLIDIAALLNRFS